MSKDETVVTALLGVISGGLLTWCAVLSGRRREREEAVPQTESGEPPRSRRRASHQRTRLGEILVKKHRVIDQHQLAAALAEQGRADKKLGEVLIEMGLITEDELASALYSQLTPPDPWLDAVG